MTGRTRTFPPAARSVPEARRFVCSALTSQGAPRACDDAETLVSELATNAVLHAHTVFTIDVACVAGTVRIQVNDLSGVLPRIRRYGVDSATGRGIRLVATLAANWGVDRTSSGKSIWFELPCEGTTTADPEGYDAQVDLDAFLAAFDDDGPDHAEPRGPRVRSA